MNNTPHTQNLSKRHQSENRDCRNGRPVPEITQHFQASNFSGSCGSPTKFEHPAFRDISKDYFADEAPRGFAVDAALFAALIATALLPIVDTAQAVATLIHHIGVL
ncbi:MAG: hypothetical protein H0X34_19385 [Chthoniobacterales bacterium]|nr:hypothetical protein [Chthoniobacterales bacterium]